MGDGTTTNRWTPEPVSVLTDVAAVAGGRFHSLFLSPGAYPDPPPSIVGTWPADGGTESSVQHLIVAFSKIVQNVTPDDVSLSAGAVTDVAGCGDGPYVFYVTGVCGPISATIDGDIIDESGQALTPYTFDFTVPTGPDINGDGQVTLPGDVPPFIDALLGLDVPPPFLGRSDMNCDGTLNGLDVQPFVDTLIGP